MAAGRLLAILVLLMGTEASCSLMRKDLSAGPAPFGISMPVPAFGVEYFPTEYCVFHRDIYNSAPFELGTAAAIHLGNTNSCIAGYDFDPGTGTGADYYQFCIPSWVAVTENGTLAGEAAMNHAAVSPGTTFSGFMRFMNRGLQDPVVKRAMELVPYKFVHWLGSAAIQVETADHQESVFSVPHLAAVLIAELKQRAEAHLGRDISHAVVAVPRHLTYFGRQDVVFAASIWGGFRGGVKAIDHQIAAAAAYGHHHDTEQGEEKTILVLRVGGHTSDATIFKFVHGKAVRYVYSQDDYFLGGHDMTERIVDYMAELIEQRHQWDIRHDGEALRRLRVACEHAKKALSDEEQTVVQVVVDGTGGGVSFSAPLTRAKFEELNQDLLDRAMALLDGAVTNSGGRQPRGAESPKDLVDEIVLVGGSARIPKLRQLVKDYMGGREPSSRKGVGAEEATVRGTAVLSRPEAAPYVEECYEK